MLLARKSINCRLGCVPKHSTGVPRQTVLLIAGFFFTYWMIFLLHKQRRQSNEGVSVKSRDAPNRCQTIGRLPINTKSYRNRTKACSSHCIIQHWRWTRAGWREGWRGKGLRGVVDHWPVITRAVHPSPCQWRHPSHVATDGQRLARQHPTRFHTTKHNGR